MATTGTMPAGTVKLVPQGKKYALELDESVVKSLGIGPNTPLMVSSDGRTLFISPARSKQEEEEFQAALAKGHEQYGRMLKRLAE